MSKLCEKASNSVKFTFYPRMETRTRITANFLNSWCVAVPPYKTKIKIDGEGNEFDFMKICGLRILWVCSVQKGVIPQKTSLILTKRGSSPCTSEKQQPCDVGAPRGLVRIWAFWKTRSTSGTSSPQQAILIRGWERLGKRFSHCPIHWMKKKTNTFGRDSKCNFLSYPGKISSLAVICFVSNFFASSTASVPVLFIVAQPSGILNNFVACSSVVECALVISRPAIIFNWSTFWELYFVRGTSAKKHIGFALSWYSRL